MEEEPPYKECETCKDLSDCPSPLVLQDGMGSPTTPEDCPQSNEILKNTFKRYKNHSHAKNTD